MENLEQIIENSENYKEAISLLNYTLEKNCSYFNDKENIKEFIKGLHSNLSDPELSDFLDSVLGPKLKTILGDKPNWLSLYDESN